MSPFELVVKRSVKPLKIRHRAQYRRPEAWAAVLWSWRTNSLTTWASTMMGRASMRIAMVGIKIRTMKIKIIFQQGDAFIMGPRLSPGATKWSSCSKRFQIYSIFRFLTPNHWNLSSYQVNCALSRFVWWLSERLFAAEQGNQKTTSRTQVAIYHQTSILKLCGRLVLYQVIVDRKWN